MTTECSMYDKMYALTLHIIILQTLLSKATYKVIIVITSENSQESYYRLHVFHRDGYAYAIT